MVIILITLCIPLTAIVVGLLTLKAVQLGLRWKIQTNMNEQLSLEINKPVAPIVKAKQSIQHEQEVQNILDEWINGVEEEGR
ncbi:hypothetical protein V7157_03865 [Neobacillus drentensis]|uniref:hypothetical protein n=1 Tax=Neobacillus drentensis TaxID=220684 RepID=UPI002FFD9C1F